MTTDNRVSVSVVMATYNGVEYLNQQLLSLARQIRRPDEIVICDDLSDDGTFELIEAFKSNHQDLQIRINLNNRRLGPLKNFENALNLAKGDIIFFCDQDDSWCESKILKMSSIFETDSTIAIVFCNLAVTDEKLSPKGFSAWEHLKFDPSKFSEQLLLNQVIRRNMVTGAGLAIRKKFFFEGFPAPSTWLHDEWISLYAAVCRLPVKLVPDTLVYYRQHSQNFAGMRSRTLSCKLRHRTDELENERRKWSEAFDWFSLKRTEDKDFAIKLLEGKKLHLEARLKGNPIRILLELMGKRYYLFSNGTYSFVIDLVAYFFTKREFRNVRHASGENS